MIPDLSRTTSTAAYNGFLPLMSTTLNQYREAKQNWLKLRNQARKELIARFHEVAAELLQIQKELLEDFGEKVSMPLKAKKATAKKAAPLSVGLPVAAPVVVKPAPVAVKAAPAPLKTPAASPAAKSAPVAVALRKKLDAQNRKLVEAKAAGKPTKAIEDRIYEIEDDIRVAQSA